MTRSAQPAPRAPARHRLLRALALALALTAPGLAALAQSMGHDMPGGEAAGEAAAAYAEANARMHEAMAIDYTGDPDVDFIRSMIPHHQGAIDMARIVLERGQDPEVRRLAEEVIAAQEAEIAWMQNWLAAKGQ